MSRIILYSSQIEGVNISSIPTASIVKVGFDAGTTNLVGYLYGGNYYELTTPVNGRTNLVAFKVEAISAIQADFETRLVGRSQLIELNFAVAVVSLNVVFNVLTATINFLEGAAERNTQFQNFFGLVFSGSVYLLANATGGTDSGELQVPAATTLLAQQGRTLLQIP